MEESYLTADNGREVVEVTAEAVIFQNPDNGYTVLRVSGAADSFTAVGIMPHVGPGELLTLEGSWMTHPSFGEQFKADSVQVRLPEGTQAIYRYLASGVIRGIGEKMARRIVDKFGADTFQVLEFEPEKLASIKGITSKKARAIQMEFIQKAGMRSLLEFLASHDLPVELGPRLWKVYGPGTMDVLHVNPYVLLGGDLGVDFATADRLAYAAGIRPDDSQRLEAGVLYTLSHNLDNGHVFLPEDKLLQASGRLLNTDPELPISGEALEEALSRLEVRAQVVREEVLGLRAVYRADLYEAECYIAQRLEEMAANELYVPDRLDHLVDRVEREAGIVYAGQQRRAVELAARRQVILLTGGPGTGKTTTLKSILACFEAMGLETSLAAPTGRAAKRLGELCGEEAYTIHRLLEAGYDQETGHLAFSHDEDDPLPAKAIIVDEMSMVDVPLMDALLRAVAGDCRLVLVGDPDQLPSVGPGQLFDHLIRSGVIPTVRLTEIFRQAQQSAIIMGAHQVNQGILPPLINQGKSKDFFFLRRLQGEQAVQTIVELCKTRLPNNMGIPPEQIQVLSPTRRYITGTANLNKALQQALNPPQEGKEEVKYGSVVFRPGDRVMQIRNNYDIMWREQDGLKGGMGVFNGDIGIVLSADSRDRVVTVSFDGRVVEYTADLLSELELAYAMTVHKSQGSEYRAVILAAVSGAPMLLTRGVLYTGITRARDLFIAVGDEQILARMVENNRQTRRYSGLRGRLTGEVKGPEEENLPF
ncbi:MAG: ATP-dependent RecD-like DNA helicase [Oscillospiraceae bacterium]|nr:ATP-dependent RecD-like DNA helicase [Oscillospiraceae bacterium]